MFLQKSTNNTIRRLLKKHLISYKDARESARKKFEELSCENARANFENDRIGFIGRINRKFHLEFPYRISYDEVLAHFRELKNTYASHVEIVNTMLRGLTKKGFDNVTYRLPLLLDFCWDSSIAISYLMVSGIKRNSIEKESYKFFMDDLEAKIYELEKKMGKYISDDYEIDYSNLVPFLELYKQYIETVFLMGDIVNKKDFSERKDELLLIMGLYVTYMSELILVGPDKVVSLYSLLMDYRSAGIVSIEEAVDLVCRQHIYGVKKDMKRKEKNRNPLDDYIVNGEVVALCDTESFKKLLEGSSLDEERKAKVFQKMEQALEEERMRLYREKLESLKGSLLDEEELKLYNLAKCYKESSEEIQNIDAIFELILASNSGKDNNILYEELKSSLAVLKRMFAANLQECVTVPSIVYYPVTLSDGKGGLVTVPVILKSILAEKLNASGYFIGQYLELLDGIFDRDRKIKLQNLPCDVWMKGREFRIAYTKVGDSIVIIDAASEENFFAKVADICASEEFKSFLESVKTYVQKGGKPTSKGYSELINTALYRKDKIMAFINEKR